jgi:hypothetical protein
MAAAKAPTRGTVAADKAVIPQALSNDDLMALLGQTGAVAQAQGEFHRMSLKAGILETDDGEMFAPKKNGPSLTVRIVKPPVYYNAFFLSETEENGAIDARRIGRPDLNGRFVRKYDDPAEQAANTNPANDAYDLVAQETGQRGSFKADVQVQIVPEDGQMTGEETIYTLTLSTTSVFEWRGSSREPSAGSVSDENFIVKLAKLAVAQAIESGADETAQKTAVLNAMTALRLGGVIADVYLLRAEDDKKTRTWWVISFVPVHIEPATEQPALASGEPETGDDVPF